MLISIIDSTQKTLGERPKTSLYIKVSSLLLEATRACWHQDSCCAITMLRNSRYYFKNYSGCSDVERNNSKRGGEQEAGQQGTRREQSRAAGGTAGRQLPPPTKRALSNFFNEAE
jgi:hypothetical protein